MTMHITTLVTHYSPEQAEELIRCLDTLRDALWHTYGEQILQQHCAHEHDRRQREFDFNDEPPF
jgi:hypothetical protein